MLRPIKVALHLLCSECDLARRLTVASVYTVYSLFLIIIVLTEWYFLLSYLQTSNLNWIYFKNRNSIQLDRSRSSLYLKKEKQWNEIEG